MSIRILACFAFVLFFSFFAYRNWFVSTCACLLLTAVIQHPDLPNSIGGIQGLNPWNVLIGNVLLAWMLNRAREGHLWDLPREISFLGITFFAVILWSFVRLAMDPVNLEDYTLLSGISEYLINCLKWVLPGILLFDGCRTKTRVFIGLGCVLAVYFLLAVQVIRWVPLRFAIEGGPEFTRIAYKLIQNEIGYNRVTLSMMLGGAAWAAIALVPLFQRRGYKLGMLALSGSIALGQALTAGRTGYVSWAFVGLVFGVLRWRRLLLLMPVAALALLAALPGVRDRISMGFADSSGPIVQAADTSEMTSGRTVIWPEVLKKIGERPFLGYGRLAMRRSGLTGWLLENLEEDNFGHPHNAYLEQLFDNGLIGFVGVVPFYCVLLWKSASLFRRQGDPLAAAAGGVALALLVSLLFGALGGQTFYPREGSVGMWAACGIMLRVWVERRNSLLDGSSLFEDSAVGAGELSDSFSSKLQPA